MDTLKTHLTGLLAAALLMPFAASSQPQDPVNLRSTAGFAVLAGSLVSNIPTSAITGDIGLSPAGGSNITGFGGNEVTGDVFTVDATGPAGSVPSATMLTAAKGDMTLAYDDAAGRTPVPSGPFLNPGAGNIGGLTLVPGLYKFTSGLSILGSDLTLSGNATDVWIFQIASDLSVGNGIQVILSGGARAANIFWQVGTSATLGTTCVFKGTILADQSISLNTGAVLEGRALASIAAVTLASNAITLPAEPAVSLASQAPRGFALSAGRQNRLDAGRTFEFTVPATGKASLKMLDIRGREVGTLFQGPAEAGKSHRVGFDTAGLAKGLYFSKLEFNGRFELARLVLVD